MIPPHRPRKPAQPMGSVSRAVRKMTGVPTPRTRSADDVPPVGIRQPDVNDKGVRVVVAAARMSCSAVERSNVKPLFTQASRNEST